VNFLFLKEAQNFESDLVNTECRFFSIDVEIDEDQGLRAYDKYIPKEAKHGDMIKTSTKYLRSLEVYFVNSTLIELDPTVNSGYKCKLIRELCQEDTTGSGYCSVPKVVTRKIKNPIKFYEGAFDFFEDYSEIDFTGIDIDTVAHQELLKEFTGGRSVSADKECFYFLSGTESDPTKGKLKFLFSIIFNILICLII
jgi:hypothetical protein